MKSIMIALGFFAASASLISCTEITTQNKNAITKLTKNEHIQTYRIESPFQKSPTTIRVLLPDNFSASKSYKVLYILPVVIEDNRRYGDGLLEIMEYKYHNTHQLICVAPEFTSMPWYADHSTDTGRQDESHLLKTVIPFIDNKFPTLKTKEGRLLIGFSKSGWGALTLLLRNPDVFYKAAAWDSGIRVDTGPIDERDREKRIKEYFGSKQNFEKYRITNLLNTQGKHLGSTARIFYFNTEGTRARGGVEIHRQMVELQIPHRYRFELKRIHRWDSGWIPLAVDFLVNAK